jgi:hypothetical protein
VISLDHLNPGTSGQIKASVDTTGKKGPLEKHVSVYSNDHSNPVVSLSLIMDIIQK